MSRRKLTQEEQELWRRVAGTTDRLHHDPPARKQAVSEIKNSIQRPKAPIKDLQVGSAVPSEPKTRPFVVAAADKRSSVSVAMDQKAFGKLRRGKLKPEARIDLHGMTLAQAQPALIGFILRAQGQGKRLVLVITGKGKAAPDDGPIPVRRGILRRAVPQWLSSAPLTQAVLQVSEAHAKHGGGGAFYVYLRRNR